MRSFLVLLALSCTLVGAEYYVSPNGRDEWTGTRPDPTPDNSDGPFATLERAREAVRQDKGPRIVHLRGGRYELPDGFKLDARDTGQPEAPVTWRNYANEKPVLVGGMAVGAWKPWKDGIFSADLLAQKFKKSPFKQLYLEGERQHLARYPNFDPANPYGGGWAYADGEIWPMYAEKEGEDKRTLLVKPADWRTWARPTDAEIFIFPRYNWWNDILKVKSVDAASRIITTERDASYAMRANDRYYFQGPLEELDAPGEWHLDREKWMLYFKPPEALANPAALEGKVYVPTVRDLLTIESADHLTIRGLTFECAEGSAIVLNKARHCRLVACTVRNTGDFSGTGISVRQGQDNGIIGCDISGTGRDGISLNGGDRTTLTGTGHFAENCYIHHVGVFYKQGVGVSLSGVGQRVSHCLIHDTPRFAIIFGGNSHALEYNHLRHIALETEDVGATYSGGRDWISPRGAIIRYNYIHDVLGYGWNGKWTSPYFAWGIYLDDNSGGVDVIGNIVARCGRSLIHGHSARDCRVENNIFIEGGLRQWEFNGWTTKSRFWTDHFPNMVKGYESIVGQPAWRFMRGMQFHPRDIPDAEGRVMSGNNFQRNIMSWSNPDSKALNVVAINPDRNVFDRNLYWNGGHALKTGIRKPGPVVGPNLVPNPTFSGGEQQKLPPEWQWQIRTPNSSAGTVEEDGRTTLRIGAAYIEAKKRDNFPIVVSRDIELKPGASYRLRAKMRSDHDQAKAALMVQFYLPPKDGQPGHFWASSPSEAKLATRWQDFEFAFNIPARGERGWHEKMAKFRVRIDWPAKEGALFVSDVALEETAMMDEWASWQASGFDRNSIIADPKFIAPEKDDYRLAADSPAWALGFQAIPTQKIGPYQSQDRASWPIIEAEGARERPLTP